MSVVSQSARSSAAAPLSDAEFDFPTLGSALWRSKWKVLGPTLLVALVTLFVVQVIPPKYLSESRVLIENRDNVYLRPDADKDILARTAVDEETVTSQVQLVLSRDLARDVIAKLRLGERPEFNAALHGVSPLKSLLGRLGLIKDPMLMTPQERVLEAYYERLNVYAIDKSRVIVIDFMSQDPELAANVANTIAEEYLARQRIAKQDQARTAVQWLSGEIETLQKKVADAEAKVAAFRGDSNLLVGPNDTTLSAQELGDVNAQIAAARAQMVDAEAKAKIIRQMLSSGQPIESSDILNSELIRRLSEQRVTLRAELAEQSTSLGDRHPRIKELKAQIADLDAQIRAEAESIARSFENDARIANARVASLMANFDQLKNQAASTNERGVELRALERDAKAQRDLLESYLAKYREATARDTINSSPADARVISRATVSNLPAYPKKLPSVLIATVATMMLCCGFVLTKELLRAPGGIPGPRLAPRIVAPKPQRVVSAGATAAPAMAGADRPAAAAPIGAVSDVAQNLRLSGAARVAVLGAARGVRSGEAAIKLARALAKNGRVVLIGLEPENSAIEAICSDPSADGMAELAAGTASFGNIIGTDELSAVHVILPGHSPIERLALLSSPRLAPSFEALSRSYDYLVADAGEAEGVELEAIAEIAPQAVLVAETPANGASEAARERLLAAGFDSVIVLAGARGAAASKAAAA
jgi:polysaccharide biosynthesis transport protein